MTEAELAQESGVYSYTQSYSEPYPLTKFFREREEVHACKE